MHSSSATKQGLSESELDELLVDLTKKNMLNVEHALNKPHPRLVGGLSGGPFLGKNIVPSMGCFFQMLDTWWESKLASCVSLHMLKKGVKLAEHVWCSAKAREGIGHDGSNAEKMSG